MPLRSMPHRSLQLPRFGPLPLAPGLVLALLLATSTTSAQEARLQLTAPAEAPAMDAWVELTLVDDPARSWTARWSVGPDEPTLELPARFADVPFTLCAGAQGFGAACRAVDPVADAELVDAEAATIRQLELELVAGTPVVGRYVLGLDPVAGAEVAVVPRLPSDAGRGFALGPMPLGATIDDAAEGEPAADGFRVVRSVATDDSGAFRLPRLAPGTYLLETLLPTRRIHRSEPFEVPTSEALAVGEGLDASDDADAADDSRPALDLGEIDVVPGLELEVVALDPAGEPLAGVAVEARQGDDASSLVRWSAATGEDGRATLSGFDAERPVVVSCRAAGWVDWSQSYELLPTTIDCELTPIGRITGTVVTVLDDPALDDAEAEPPIDGRVSLHSIADDGTVAARPTAVVTIGDEGAFVLEGSTEGSWRLVVAAPGYGVETVDVDLEVGERRDLGLITLGAGRAVALHIVDAETGEPVPDAAVEAVAPEGAARGVADADGALDLSLGAEEVLVVVRAEGYATADLRLSVADARARDDEPMTVRLRPGGWIRALLWSDTGGEGAAPCRRCEVRVPAAEAQRRPVVLVTDAAGEAFSEALRPGRYRVVRSAVEQLGSTVLERPEAEVRWTRVVAGEVATVRFGAREERLRVIMDPPPDGRWAVTARTPTSRQRLEPDAEGAVVVERDRGETIHLYLHVWDPEAGAEIEIRQGPLTRPSEATDGFGTVVVGESLDGEASSGFDPAGAVAAGATVRFAPGTGAVRGRAVRRAAAGGEGVGGAPVTLREVGGGWLAASARTHPDGSFHVPYLPEGVYQLYLGDHAVQNLSVGRGERVDVREIQHVGGIVTEPAVDLPGLEEPPLATPPLDDSRFDGSRFDGSRFEELPMR